MAVEDSGFYQQIFEMSPDAILVIEEERFIECNPAAVAMLRFPSKEALLQRYSGGTSQGSLRAHPAEMSPPTQPDGRDSFEKAEELMRRTIERGSARFEWEHVRADGEIFPVEVILRAIGSPERRRILVVWREIAERMKLEQQLRRSQRLQSVGQLAGGIAHDFNNLLVVLLSQSNLLRTALANRDEDEELAEAAGDLVDASERAAALTRRLLTFSRGQPSLAQSIAFGPVLADLRTMLDRLIREDLTLSHRISESPISVRAEASQLEQIVVNLVTNARDAIRAGGHIDVSLAREERPASGPHVAGEYAVLRVSDDGVGMTPSQVEQAFDPFFTTKSVGNGSGLGLATVHSIADQLGGTVEIESRVDVGTCVTVVLPLSSEAPDEAVEDPPPEAPRTEAGGEHVLVVEDEERVRRLLTRILERDGYTVTTARDGEEALELALASADRFDLVLTDVVMPRRSGPAFVEAYLEARPDVPVVFMSGYDDEGQLSGAKIPEHATLLQKPFANQQILDVLRSALDAR
ncbi:MAG: ATP-binding protein [Myxococcota bacterium]